MALSNRDPDWEWWTHVPTVTLREAVALSLDLDPNRSRELLNSYERQSFEKRLALANRCLGHSLPGPLNFAQSHYFDAEPVVRLAAFAAWAIGVDLQVPSALAKLSSTTEGSARHPQRSAVEGQPDTTSTGTVIRHVESAGGADSLDRRVHPFATSAEPDPNERLTLPEQLRLLARIMPEERARARIDKAFRLREISYHPKYAVSYDDARIDWVSGRVILSRLPRQPFTPTLTAAEFFAHFMPSRTSTPPVVTPQAPSAPKRGGPSPRPGNRPPSREKPFWPAARAVAFEWLSENGCPARNDGNQATLEKFMACWLENNGHDASESAVRRHVKQWIEERRAELNA
jgi:hypothetical protein